MPVSVNLLLLAFASSVLMCPTAAYSPSSSSGAPSGPEPFGYKMGWIVVRSNDPNAVASALPVRSKDAADWHAGIEAAYQGGPVFVSPPVAGWVCIIGQWAMGTGDNNSVKSVAKIVADLSARFGEAQGYATERVIEYHHWILAKHGQVIRCFAYLGESGEVLSNVGTVTEAEKKLRFGARPSGQWSPDEEDVMKVASVWSFDPTKLNSSSGAAAKGVVVRMK
jgi:hypothetical protein